MGTELHIEAIDEKPARPMLLDESEMIDRLLRAGRLIDYVISNYAMSMADTVIKQVGYHRFHAPQFSATGGASPAATYNLMVFDLKPDEALIIESEIPDPKFWNLVLQDVWGQTIDYIYHQSSLNGHQAHVDDDGKFRIVISKEDPGVLNWIDPVTSLRGVAVVRWYFAKRKAHPSATKIPLAKVLEYLPKDTLIVTPTQRKKLLEQRRRSALRRYGY